MQIELMSTDRLVPYIRNARPHSAHPVAQIAASIAAFGFINPILIGVDDVIIAGHGRLMAAKSLGLPEVPVMVLDHLDDVYRRGLALADNRTAEGAAWNEQLLALELGALRDADFDTEVTGFSDIEIEDLFAGLDHLGDVGFGAGLKPSGDGNATHGSGAAEPPPVANASLAERFGIPPFSILDARKGWWQDRKRAWIDIGIQSELGRGEGDRACPGGSPMPGNGSRNDCKPSAAKVFMTTRSSGRVACRIRSRPPRRRARRERWRHMAKGLTKTFGHDLMLGEPEVGGDKTNGGVLMPSHSSGDPGFYAKKRAKEAELGRELSNEDYLTDHYQPSDAPTASGTSIFDPVLCEIAYRCFCPPGGTVLDPFAGGSVRGVVASRLSLPYDGVELRGEQVAANKPRPG